MSAKGKELALHKELDRTKVKLLTEWEAQSTLGSQWLGVGTKESHFQSFTDVTLAYIAPAVIAIPMALVFFGWEEPLGPVDLVLALLTLSTLLILPALGVVARYRSPTKTVAKSMVTVAIEQGTHEAYFAFRTAKTRLSILEDRTVDEELSFQAIVDRADEILEEIAAAKAHCPLLEQEYRQLVAPVVAFESVARTQKR